MSQASAPATLRHRDPITVPGSPTSLATCGVGLAWEQCPYCIDRDERMRNRQRRLLLRPELPDRDDNARPGALEAWGDRLAHGISTGVVTAADADAAWEREQ